LDAPLSKNILVIHVKKSYIKIKIQEIRKYYFGWEYKEIEIKKGHVHLYMVILPKYAVYKLVKTIKKNTKRSLDIKSAFWGKMYQESICRERKFCIYSRS